MKIFLGSDSGRGFFFGGGVCGKAHLPVYFGTKKCCHCNDLEVKFFEPDCLLPTHHTELICGSLPEVLRKDYIRQINGRVVKLIGGRSCAFFL